MMGQSVKVILPTPGFFYNDKIIKSKFYTPVVCEGDLRNARHKIN